MVGFRGGDPGAGRLRETGLLGFSMGIAADPDLAAPAVVVEGTNEGAETESDDPCFFASAAAAALPLTVAASAEVPALVDAAVDILATCSPV